MRLENFLSGENLFLPLRSIAQPPEKIPEPDLRGKLELEFAAAEQVAERTEELDFDFGHGLAQPGLTPRARRLVHLPLLPFRGVAKSLLSRR